LKIFEQDIKKLAEYISLNNWYWKKVIELESIISSVIDYLIITIK
jgi:hypothetical protein